MEAEEFRLEARPTDVAAILGAAAAAAAPAAEAAGVRVQVRTQGALRPLVTDGERLRQIVDALVDNAVRALEGTPDGRVVLTATVDPAGAVRLEVVDNGPGLAADDLAVAFEAGLLSERYRGRRRVGAGVGLALVGELARRLGGHAEASPAEGGGVVFAVVLPDTRTLP